MGRVVGWAPDGDGVVDVDGRRVVVPGVLPGERVEIARPARGPGATAALVRVLSPSPHRVTPGCPHAGPCGGCRWQHVAYPEQLRTKRALLQAQLDAGLGPHSVRVARVEAPTDTGAPPEGFRAKAHFVVAGGGRGGALAIGHYRRGTQRLLPVTACPVHHPRANEVAFAFLDALARAGVVGAGEEVGRGAVRHLVVRVGRRTGETLVTLVVTRRDDPAVRAASRAVLASPSAPDGLHVNVHADAGSYLFGRETRHVAGRDRLCEEVAGTRFLTSPTAFFQTNVDAAERLVQLVLDRVAPGRRVLDLYAGVGLFSLPLARRGHAVIAIEESAAAVADAEASRALNRVEAASCRFVRGRVERALGRLVRSDRAFDVVILDPPRHGCHPRVLDEVLGAVRPARVIYVSCHADALVRDLARAFEAGHGARYALAHVVPVDMFPHTPHVEVVAVLDARTR